MLMDEHTSEMVWTWTINELCRTVVPPELRAISESSLPELIAALRGIPIAQ